MTIVAMPTPIKIRKCDSHCKYVRRRRQLVRTHMMKQRWVLKKRRHAKESCKLKLSCSIHKKKPCPALTGFKDALCNVCQRFFTSWVKMQFTSWQTLFHPFFYSIHDRKSVTLIHFRNIPLCRILGKTRGILRAQLGWANGPFKKLQKMWIRQFTGV